MSRDRGTPRRKSPERAPMETNYDQAVRAKEIRNQKMAAGKVVVKTKDLPWELNRQGRIKNFLTDQSQDVEAPGGLVSKREINKPWGWPRHRGGTFIFILGGKGYSMVNGVRYDWQAGDLTILPMVPGGVAHQHFNLAPAVPALWMRVAYTPHKRFALAHWIHQLEDNPGFADVK